MVNAKFRQSVPGGKLHLQVLANSVFAAIVNRTARSILLAHQDSEQHSLFNPVYNKICPPILPAPSHKLA